MNKFVEFAKSFYGLVIYFAVNFITAYIVNSFKDQLSITVYNIILIVGAIISILFGFIIPTGKVIVGLGLIKFKMPVSLVFSVNTGILLSGLMLFKNIFDINIINLLIIIGIIIALMILIYLKSKKFNTIAVLIGMIGYLLLYISLITLSIKLRLIYPIIFYAIAIILFFILVCIGIKADLKNPKVHWIIESCNVLCQFLVMLGTLILF